MSSAPVPRYRSVPRAPLVLVGIAAAVVVIAGMKAASGIIGPAFLALVITIATHPLHRWLRDRLPSWLATTVCLLVVNAAIVALAVSLVVATARFATLLPAYEEEFDSWTTSVAERLHDLGISAEQVEHLTSSFDLSRLADLVTSILSGALGLASGLVFVVTLLLFMIIDGAQFPRQLAKTAEVRPALVDALDTFALGTRRYLMVSTVFGLVVAALDTIALALLDIPAPLLWGLLAFLTNYIPNIGFVIGVIPPAVLALLEGGPGLMLAVVVVYSALNLVIQSGIQPKVVGDAVGLSTTLTFLSLVFWSWVVGPVGAVLAVPLSLLVRALLVDADPESRWLVPLVANRQPAEPRPEVS